MFATLTGPWPRIAPDGQPLAGLEAGVAAGVVDPAALEAAIDALVADVVRVQVEAGLELVSDGQVGWPDLATRVASGLDGLEVQAHGAVRVDGNVAWRTPILVDAWRATVGATVGATAEAEGEAPAVVVKQAVPGPYSLARRLAGVGDRATVVLALADALAAELEALAAAGCALVEVEEPDAVAIGADAGERALFLEAGRRLLARAPDLHATLAITGGSADAAGPETILGAPFRSYLFDLIAGPDNWRLVAAAPGDRGIVCGALPARAGGEDPAPLLLFAGRYAASTRGRGPLRVGLANASSLASLDPAEAAAKVRILGRAVAYTGMSPDEAIAAGLDPRTVSVRAAATGRAAPRRPRGGR